MSNSKRFFLGLTATALAALALLLAAAFVMDPRGIVAPAFPGTPMLCAEGTDMAPRELKPFIALAHQPREILVGNSRVQNGFAAGDARALLNRPTANLAVDAARFDEVLALTRQAWSVAPVERVWIGIDYVMFVDRSPPLLRFPRALDRRHHALRYGVADPAVIRTAAEYLSGGEGCRRPARTRLGFQHPTYSVPPSRWWLDNPNDRLQVRLGNRLVVQRQVDFHASAPAAERIRLREARRQALGELVREARAKNVRMVLFIAPSHSELLERLATVGLLEDHEAWRRDMATLAASERSPGLALIDIADDAAVAAAARRWPCTEGAAAGCPFYDLSHYDTPIGRQILELGTAATGESAVGSQ